MRQNSPPHEHTRPGGSKHATTSTHDTRLAGWWLTLARAVVLAVSAVTVGLGVYALALWPRLATHLLTPEQIEPLGRLGITPLGLTLAIVAMYGVVIALTNGVAALLLWRRSDDAMALLIAVTLVLLPALFSPMYSALSGVWRIAGEVLSVLCGMSFLLLLVLFPSGRFVPRWIWAPPLAIAIFAASPPGGILPTALGLPLVLMAMLSLIGGQSYRYRSVSTPLQRQQTKWAVVGLILALLVNQLFWQPDGWVPALQRKDSLYSLLMYPDFALLIGIIAVTFGVAILRYRLYDIDIIIRRTLIYGSLTGILAGIYFAVVLGAQMVTRRLTGQPGQEPIVIVATTLFIAVLFTPLRRWLQALIDRAFYRSKYDAGLTFTAFGVKMRVETDLPVLQRHLVEVVEQTLQPSFVQLWLRDTSRSPGDRIYRLSPHQQQRLRQKGVHRPAPRQERM